MAMFGQTSPIAKYDPSQLSKSDKLMLFGAMMRDTGAALRGGEADSVLNTQALLAQRQQWALQRAAMGRMMGLFGGSAPQYQDGPAPNLAAPQTGVVGTSSDFGTGASDQTGAPAAAPMSGIKVPSAFGSGMSSVGAAGTESNPSATQATPDASSPPVQPWTYQWPRRIAGTGASPSLTDPQTQQTLMAAAMLGAPGAKEAIDMLKATLPQYDAARPGTQMYNKLTGELGAKVSNPQYYNDQLVDPTRTDAPTFVPKYDVGTMPDGRGGVIPMPGKVASDQALAQAKALGATLGSVQTVTRPDGRTGPMLGSQLFGSGGSAPMAGAGGAADGAFGPSPQDTEYRKEQAIAAAGRYKALQDAGSSAPGAVARLRAMGALLSGFNGGKLAPDMYDIASGLNSLGIKIDPRLPNKDAAQVLQRSMATEAMKNPDTGANMFPRVTNFEYENALKQVPGMLQSEAGRNTVLEMKIAEQNRIQDIAAKARQWNQRFGRFDAPDNSGKTFQDYLDAWSAKHPLYAGIKGLTTK